MGIGGLFNIFSNLASLQKDGLFRRASRPQNSSLPEQSPADGSYHGMISRIMLDETKFLVCFPDQENYFHVPPEWQTDIIVAHKSHKRITYAFDQEQRITLVGPAP